MSDKNLLQLIVSKIDGPVFSGDVVSVTVPGLDGEMTILANHQPLISPLKKGTVTIKAESEQETHEIEKGILEVSANKVIILI